MRRSAALLSLSLAASTAPAQLIQVSPGECLDAETLTIVECEPMPSQAIGDGILEASYPAVQTARAYLTQRSSLWLIGNSNWNKSARGDNWAVGYALHGAGSRRASSVGQWRFGYKSPGEAASTSGSTITSNNNAPQYGNVISRNVSINGYGTLTHLLQDDAAAIYTDLGLSDTDISRTLAAISNVWDAHYFEDNVGRQGATGSGGTIQWGLIFPKSMIDDSVDSWIEGIYVQVGTGGTPGSNSEAEFYLTTVNNAGGSLPVTPILDAGHQVRDSNGNGIDIAGSVADSKLRLAVVVAGGNPVSDEADWASDSTDYLMVAPLTAFRGRNCFQAFGFAQDFASGFSLIGLHGEGGQTLKTLQETVEQMDQDAMAAVIEADALGQLRGTNGNDGVANIAIVFNEIFNSAGSAGAAQLSSDGVNNHNTAAGYTAELTDMKAWWASVFTKAQTLLDSSSAGSTINWCFVLPNEHKVDTATKTNLATERTLIEAAGTWAATENAGASTSGYTGVVVIDPQTTDMDVSAYYDSSTDQYHLDGSPNSAANAEAGYGEKWDAIFYAIESATESASGGPRSRLRLRTAK